jgi:hypothetical protein
MTQFLDVRLAPVGGELAKSVAVNQTTEAGGYESLPLGELQAAIQGRHVLVATHGFNVNRADGIACLSNWGNLLQLPEPYSAFVGLLWPGDSIWAHGLDYPGEPRVADDAGGLIAEFLDANFGGAASLSLASHSLGARVILSAIAQMSLPVRRVVIMAGAVDDNCLQAEFQAAAAKIGRISLLSSKKDEVLSMAFPLGNFVAGILTEGHPWWHAALGHTGPATPWPANLQAPYLIPDVWDYQHGDYLQIKSPEPPDLALPVDVPPQGSAPPLTGADGQAAEGWQEAFSSAFASTRFRQA